MRQASLNVLSPLRRGRSSAAAALALAIGVVGLLGMPCAMATEAPGEHANHAEPAPHSHHHGDHEDCATADADEIVAECCCDLPSAAATNADQNPSPLKALAVAIALDTGPVPSSFRSLAEPQPPSRGTLHETSPPVYLATLRLRI